MGLLYSNLIRAGSIVQAMGRALVWLIITVQYIIIIIVLYYMYTLRMYTYYEKMDIIRSLVCPLGIYNSDGL